MQIDHGYVSEGFQKELDRALEQLDPNVTKALQDDGWTIASGKVLQEAKYELKDLMGPKPGSKLGQHETTPAVCLGPDFGEHGKFIGVAETVRVGVLNEQTEIENPAGKLRHEIGHAIDHMSNRLSLSEAFTAAYNKDMAALKAGKSNEHEEYSYYVRDGEKGQREAFAEIAGNELGGGVEEEVDIGKFLPETQKLVRQAVNNLKMGREIDHGIDRGKQAYDTPANTDNARPLTDILGGQHRDAPVAESPVIQPVGEWRVMREQRAAAKTAAPVVSRPSFGGR